MQANWAAHIETCSFFAPLREIFLACAPLLLIFFNPGGFVMNQPRGSWETV
jgi:hypothetical protein